MTTRTAGLSILLLTGLAIAHEGHAPLPTRGATVNLEKGTIVLSRESRDALGVETAELSTKPLPESSPAYVTLVSPWTKHAFASSRLPGRIAALHVAPGQAVLAGQVLAEVESLELETLQQDLFQAQTEARLVERRLQLLQESAGAVAGQVQLEAESALEQQRNALAVGRLRWRSLGLDEVALDAFLADETKRTRRLAVAAPISGTVIHADVAVGRVVEPGEHLFEIVDLSAVWAKVGVLERDLEQVRVGQQVELRLTARPAEVVPATIDAVGAALDGPGKTATAWATITNPTGEPTWLPGMTGHARLVQPPKEGVAKVVPAAALVDDGVSRYVLVEEVSAQKQSEYRRKEVAVVRRTPRLVEVRASGLFPGDRVVTKGAQQLGGFFISGVLKLSPESAATIGLETARVERRPLERVMEVDGVVDLPPSSKAAASARVGGNILRLHVQPGQRVRRGDLLAEVQSAELQTLQLDLLRESLAFELAERQFQSLRAAGGAVPRQRVLETETAAALARNRRDALRRRLEATGAPLARIDDLVARRRLIDALPVTSPIDGVVAGLDRALGQAVRAEEALFTVHDPSRTLVKAFVAERDAGRLEVGAPARIRFASNPRQAVAGKVVRGSRVFAAEDQSMAVWLEADAPSAVPLRPGQLARVALILDETSTPAGLVVPSGALVREGAKAFAFVKKPDGAFERRPVATAGGNDQFVEIAAGLVEGETVAVRGAAGLQTAHASVR